VCIGDDRREVIEGHAAHFDAFLRDSQKSAINGEMPSIRRDFNNAPDHDRLAGLAPALPLVRAKVTAASVGGASEKRHRP
jgi:hypothetical protein